MLKFTKENGFYSENKRTKRTLGSHKRWEVIDFVFYFYVVYSSIF